MEDSSNTEGFTLIHHFHILGTHTYGSEDKARQEEIRKIAHRDFPIGPFEYEWYGFRIKVRRDVGKMDSVFDLDNVAGLIINAFSGRQIEKHRSAFPEVELYEDDKLRWVRAIQIEEEFVNSKDETEVWIFGKNKQDSTRKK